MRVHLALVCLISIHSAVMTLPPSPLTAPDHMIVDKMNNEMFLYRNGTLERRFEIATGRAPHLTPEGSFAIFVKEVVPNEPSRRELFGTRWMGLKVPGSEDGYRYGIHGTGRTESIGHHASAGCIRMYTREAEELYEMVKEGTMVYIFKNRYSMILYRLRGARGWQLGRMR